MHSHLLSALSRVIFSVLFVCEFRLIVARLSSLRACECVRICIYLLLKCSIMYICLFVCMLCTVCIFYLYQHAYNTNKLRF